MDSYYSNLRNFSLMLFCLFTIQFSPISASTREFTCIIGESLYKCFGYDDGTASITVSTANPSYEPDLAVPSTVCYKTPYIEVNYTVTRFYGGVFDKGLKSITLPTSVKSIGGFSGHTLLESIKMPGVTTIENSAFSKCSSLANVSAPNVITIEDCAFSNCTNLTHLSFDNVENVGNNVFNQCTSLKQCTFPNVKSVGFGSFSGCSSLENISLKYVTQILGETFKNCKLLENISAIDVKDIGDSIIRKTKRIKMKQVYTDKKVP